MIEVIYKEETAEQDGAQETFAMPRNVRQIGLANGNYRIYVEDYVYTFLSRLAEEEKEQGKTAVLTGEIKWTADMTCIFVKGALAVDGIEVTAEHIDFSEEVWQKLQEDKEEYFPEQEIVGWFFAQHQVMVEITDLLVKVHLRYFGGEKILMLMEPGERDEAFFRYDGGTMVKVEGYYIYYEKNSQMQSYMIERNQNAGPETSEKVEDKAVRNFRKIIDSKKPEEREEEKTSVFSYAATVCLALAVLATGVAFFQNRQSSSGIPEDAATASAVIAQVTPEATAVLQNSTDAESANEVAAVPTKSATSDEIVPITAAVTQNADQPAATEMPADAGKDDIAVTETPVPAVTEKAQTPIADNSESAGSSGTEKNQKSSAKKKSEENKDAAEDAKNDQSTKDQNTQKNAQQAAETAASAQNTHQTYVIRPGDTLYQISIRCYGNTEAMEEICKLNGISANEIIYPGQVIVLP